MIKEIKIYKIKNGLLNRATRSDAEQLTAEVQSCNSNILQFEDKMVELSKKYPHHIFYVLQFNKRALDAAYFCNGGMQIADVKIKVSKFNPMLLLYPDANQEVVLWISLQSFRSKNY